MQFYPTYYLVDRHGVVRAAALQGSNVERALDLLLEEQPHPGQVARNRAAELREKLDDALAGWQTQDVPAAAAALQGRFAPALDARRWHLGRTVRNGTHIPDDASLVLVSFVDAGRSDDVVADDLATLDRIHADFADDRVIVIGMIHGERSGMMPRLAASHGVKFPLGQDAGDRLASLWGVKGEGGGHFLIHPSGAVIAAGVAPEVLERAVKTLLDD